MFGISINMKRISKMPINQNVASNAKITHNLSHEEYGISGTFSESPLTVYK